MCWPATDEMRRSGLVKQTSPRKSWLFNFSTKTAVASVFVCVRCLVGRRLYKGTEGLFACRTRPARRKTKRIGTVRFNRPKAIAPFGLNPGELADRGYRLKSEIHSSGIVSEDQALAAETRATLALRNKINVCRLCLTAQLRHV
jgi:hypothetical protein